MSLLPILGRNWFLLIKKCQGWVVFAGDPPRDSRMAFGSGCRLLVEVMFFPSFPFVGVLLFPSFVLGNPFGEGGAFLVSLSLFSPHLSLFIFSSPSPSFSVSLPLFPFPFLLFSIYFSFPFAFLFLSFPLPFSLIRATVG